MKPLLFVKRLLGRTIQGIVLNYKHPIYWGYLHDLAAQYVNFYRGDGNADMSTNGELAFLDDLCRKTRLLTVFDVGAHEGHYSQAVLARTLECHIHCFEPTPDSYNVLVKNVSDYSAHVTLNNCAVGSADETKPFFVSSLSSELNSFHQVCSTDQRTDPIYVKATTIDSYCALKGIRKINLLKIDTEGHELEVLRGGKHMLETSAIDVIQFEYGRAAIYARVLLIDLIQFLRPFGYSIYKLKPHGPERFVYSPENEGCPYANFVAVHDRTPSK